VIPQRKKRSIRKRMTATAARNGAPPWVVSRKMLDHWNTGPNLGKELGIPGQPGVSSNCNQIALQCIAE
jgi:hypothetical protein